MSRTYREPRHLKMTLSQDGGCGLHLPLHCVFVVVLWRITECVTVLAGIAEAITQTSKLTPPPPAPYTSLHHVMATASKWWSGVMSKRLGWGALAAREPAYADHSDGAGDGCIGCTCTWAVVCTVASAHTPRIAAMCWHVTASRQGPQFLRL